MSSAVYIYISISMSSAHSPTFFITSPTSQLILQHFRRCTHVTTHSPTLPLLNLCHSSVSNSSFASPTSLALHLRHQASRPCARVQIPWPANLVEVFSGSLNLIFRDKCRVGPHIPLLMIYFNVSRDLKACCQNGELLLK